MNDNAKALYEDLKNERLPQFDIHAESDDCGTPLCILGHALFRMGLLDEFEQAFIERCNALKRSGVEWLGLTWKVGLALCYPNDTDLGDLIWPWFESEDQPTQPEAAEALKRACELSEAK